MGRLDASECSGADIGVRRNLMSFAKGNIVELKSKGGPEEMAVSNVADYGPMGPEDGVLCVWFEVVKGVRVAHEHVFDAAVLKLIRP